MLKFRIGRGLRKTNFWKASFRIQVTGKIKFPAEFDFRITLVLKGFLLFKCLWFAEETGHPDALSRRKDPIVLKNWISAGNQGAVKTQIALNIETQRGKWSTAESRAPDENLIYFKNWTGEDGRGAFTNRIGVGNLIVLKSWVAAGNQSAVKTQIALNIETQRGSWIDAEHQIAEKIKISQTVTYKKGCPVWALIRSDPRRSFILSSHHSQVRRT